MWSRDTRLVIMRPRDRRARRTYGGCAPCRWQAIIINNNNKITRRVLYYAKYTLHTHIHAGVCIILL